MNEVLELITPDEREIKEINQISDKFIKKIKSEIKKQNINAEVFIGGSFAKKTIIKKEKYDVDVFLRFNEKNANFSEHTEKILLNLGEDFERIHGSRDYFNIKMSEKFSIELIPVKKISKPEDSENITDMSYSHVKFVNNNSNKKILEEIKIAKAFCYANNCYGAESYIHGFSGYSLELLIIHYKSFVKMLKELSKSKPKIIIDISKHYKNKNQIMMDLNSSKLSSPIVLIDPTHKSRNALAALSEETFKKFQTSAINFLKNPSLDAFVVEKIDFEKERKNSEKNKLEFVKIILKTKKQEGDVAGSKLLKFFKFIKTQTEKYFEIQKFGFEYSGKNYAQGFFSAKPKKEIVVEGPEVKKLESVKAFKKAHKKTFSKNGRIYSKEEIKFNLNKFLTNWKAKNIRVILEMYIDDLDLE